MRFHSTKVTDENGIVWDSKTEYNYGLELKYKENNKKISNLQRQIPYLLIPSFKDNNGNSIRKTEYIADFVFEENNKTIICDVKGSEYNIDPVFKLKWKMMKQKYLDNKDIEFRLVIKFKDVWYNLENKEEKKIYKALYKVDKEEKKKRKEERKMKKKEKAKLKANLESTYKKRLAKNKKNN